VIDPLSEKYTSWTPYHYVHNNPIMLLDMNGMEASTHTDSLGNVVAVKDDGDLGVYRHNGNTEEAKKEVDENYSEDNTSAGGEYMGESTTSLSFADFDIYKESNGTLILPGYGAKIDFNSNWATKQVDGILKSDPELIKFGLNARSHHPWDIKNNAHNEQGSW
jgi:hypothetical protein